MENYLFERTPVMQVCRGYVCAGVGEAPEGDDFQVLLDSLESELKDLVVLDVAHYRARTGHQVLPDRAESLMESRRLLTWARDRIERLHMQHADAIDQASLDEAAALVERFLDRARFVDLLRGHFVLGILRDLIANMVRRQMNRRPNIDNQGLIILLSNEVWIADPSPDHGSLKRRLRRALTEADARRRSRSAVGTWEAGSAA
jgi:hypothetical protein